MRYKMREKNRETQERNMQVEEGKKCVTITEARKV